MFSVSSKNIGGFNAIVLADSRTETSATILPEFGGILNSWIIKHDGIVTDIIEGYSSRQDWLQNHAAKGFRSAKLSPFVCRLKDGEYEFLGQRYKIETGHYLGNHAIHGLLYDKNFLIEEMFAGEDCARVKLLFNYLGEEKGYPFRYKCYVTYELHSKRRLRMITEVINTDATTIPVADGWHPYFDLRCNADELDLEIKTKAVLEMDSDLIPTGNKIPFTEFNKPKAIGTRHLDNCYLLDFTGQRPFVKVTNPLIGLSITMEPDRNYPFVQLYTPDDRKTIAIECLSSAPDAFNNNFGLTLLAMGGEKRMHVDYVAGT